jgi:hypothetical protein
MDKAFLESNLSRVHEWIKAADEKVSIWIAFQGIIITIATPYFSSQIVPKMIEHSCITIGLSFLGAAFLAISLYKSISAIIPRLKTKAGKKSVIYFGHIAGMSLAEYENALNVYTEQEYEQDLRKQIHISSQIALRKHKEFRASILTFFGSVLAIVIVIFLINS